MKYTIIILFLFFTSLCLAQEAREQQPVEADIRGRDCEGGDGLCSLEPSNLVNANAFLYKNVDGTLTLEILRGKLSAGEEAHIFGEAISLANKESLSFHQPEVYTLNAAVKSSLEVIKKKISPGTYPARITEDTITIRFSLE